MNNSGYAQLGACGLSRLPSISRLHVSLSVRYERPPLAESQLEAAMFAQ